MQIQFTKKQFENLLKLVHLGNWVANANRTDDRIKKYEDLQHYIFSFAKDFGFKDYVEDEYADKCKFFPTATFEEDTDIDELLIDYDENIFWDEIIGRLAHRDFFSKYGIDKIKKMDPRERFGKVCDCEKKYAEEVEKHGIERLEIIDK